MTLATKEVYEYLSKLVNYNPDTGIFTWLNRDNEQWNSRYANTVAGVKSHGYILIGVTYGNKKIKIRAHRLAWFIMNSEMPTDQIDHINHKRDDNRISNLRVVSNQDNNKNRPIQINNTSGFTGVTWAKHANKWEAFCKLDGKKKHLGYYDDVTIANGVVTEYRKDNGFYKLHGEKK